MIKCPQKRLLIVDDNKNIHLDFYKILQGNDTNSSMDEDESFLFGKSSNPLKQNYQIDSAYHGEEALNLVCKAISIKQPYALAFIDIQMPGWDGIETVKQIWKVDQNIQIVICSAYSDHSWRDITEKLGFSDNLLILKKPFEPIEILQLASALTKKWELIAELHSLVQKQTTNLEEAYSLSKATLESTQEGIMVINQNGDLITYNKKFTELWSISEDTMPTKKANLTIMQHLAEQVEESQPFLSLMTNLCKKPKEGIIHEWAIKEGKILELYTHPQLLNNQEVGCVFSFRDVTQRKQMEAELIHQATHDSLTGLSNRLLLLDRIQQSIIRAKRRRLQIGILLFDLDNFKQINDSFGHNAGDTLLKIIAKRLTRAVRESDTITRLGGDEFVIVLPSLNREEDLLPKINKILKIFATPIKIKSSRLIITTSIGVSVYPQDGNDADMLLKNADIALYHAKAIGRNTFQFYTSEFSEQILQKAELTTDLRQALQKKQFMLHYQPIVNLKSNKIIGVEALVRWNHPTLGIIPPGIFIPLAEDAGLITSIGEWILETACVQNLQWQNRFQSLVKIAVNISGYQFKKKNFVDIVEKILKKTKLDPHYLELELTESILLSTGEDVARKMNELKKIGVSFSLDDFGTGYASLSYLKHFPFDKIKIDKSFVEGVSLRYEDKSIVEAIIKMAKTLKIEVLAEGVEEAEQLAFIKKHHGDQIQGFYISPPIDAQMCSKFLEKLH